MRLVPLQPQNGSLTYLFSAYVVNLIYILTYVSSMVVKGGLMQDKLPAKACDTQVIGLRGHQ